MDLKEALNMKQLEEESRRLKQIRANQDPDISILKEMNSKNGKSLSVNRSLNMETSMPIRSLFFMQKGHIP